MLDGPKICLECKLKMKKAKEAKKRKKNDSNDDSSKWFFIWKWYDFIRNAF